jgi:hypothetical protein
MPERFWLYKWIDEQGVASQRDARRALKSKKAFARLQELIAQRPRMLQPLPSDATNPIVAGRAIDLSGQLDCNHPDCLKKRVDDLFGKVWHYFDQIVVEGLRGYEVEELLEEGNRDQALDLLKSHIQNLLYISSIGAEELLVFRRKPPMCALHYRDHLEEAGLVGVLEDSSGLIDQLLEGGQVDELRQHGDHWHYTYNHPMLEHTQWGTIVPEEDSPDPLADPQKAIATAIFKEYSGHLVSDVRMAKGLTAPLAASVSLHGQVLDRYAPEATVGQVALDLALPS